MTQENRRRFLKFQINEITGHHIYRRLAISQKKRHNQKILIELSNEEFHHYHLLNTHTGQLPAPRMGKVYFYTWIARLFGLTFSIKLLEKNEIYAKIDCQECPHHQTLHCATQKEKEQTAKLIELIDEDHLNYVSSIVLGLNDALVEFTGALAGYTFALREPRLIALTGAITGIAAALSMATSEYLSTRAEKNSPKKAWKAAIYTGSAYAITVCVLILPFITLSNAYWSLGICLTGALAVIAIFNYYYSVVKNENFKHRFLEMALISLGIATVSFFAGYSLREITK